MSIGVVWGEIMGEISVCERERESEKRDNVLALRIIHRLCFHWHINETKNEKDAVVYVIWFDMIWFISSIAKHMTTKSCNKYILNTRNSIITLRIEMMPLTLQFAINYEKETTFRFLHWYDIRHNTKYVRLNHPFHTKSMWCREW